jgi:hypothetical protein
MTKELNKFKLIISNIDLYSHTFPIDILEKNIDINELKTFINI